MGSAMARCLVKYGAQLFIADMADAPIDGLGGNVSYIACDLSDTQSVRALFEQVKIKSAGLDVLINNAAYGGGTGGRSAMSNELEDIDDERWALGIDGTAGVTFRCIREAVPYFDGKGAIINIASMYGVVSPDHSIYGDTGQNSPIAYGAGKAGVIQLTKYCAAYLAKDGIRVNCITPGPFPKINPQIDMDFIKKLQNKTMLGRTGEPDELAGPLLLLASDASSFMTGSNIVVDGGWTAW